MRVPPISGPAELFDRLMESRVLQEAFDWVKARLHALNITWTRIKNLIRELIIKKRIRTFIPQKNDNEFTSF